jgi:hypothetical protein
MEIKQIGCAEFIKMFLSANNITNSNYDAADFDGKNATDVVGILESMVI